MHFPSIIFIFIYLPVTLLLYYLLSFSNRLQKLWLIFVSMVFYAWGDPHYIAFPIIMTGINYLVSMVCARANRAKMSATVIAVILNLLPLAFFKYLLPANSIVPIGMAFIVLRGISYTVDVYRDELKAETNPLNLLFYMIFFPVAAAGPLMGYGEVSSQLSSRKISFNKFAVGCTRFAAGLGKKVILADNLAHVSDLIFNWSRMGMGYITVPVLTAWIGAIAFTMQIFFDLSGYCDMAIGLGLMLGFDLPENFDYPYAAKGVSSFWNRWHITLIQWFKDYVYRLLGADKSENTDLTIINIFITCLLIGMWHGKNWTYLFWALWHCVFIILERFMDRDYTERHPALMHIYTLLEIIIGWVLFRADDIYQAYIYLRNMFAMNRAGFADDNTWFVIKEYWFFLVIGLVLCMPLSRKVNNYLVKKSDRPVAKALSIAYPIFMFAVVLASLSYIIMTTNTSFIYF